MLEGALSSFAEAIVLVMTEGGQGVCCLWQWKEDDGDDGGSFTQKTTEAREERTRVPLNKNDMSLIVIVPQCLFVSHQQSTINNQHHLCLLVSEAIDQNLWQANTLHS